MPCPVLNTVDLLNPHSDTVWGCCQQPCVSWGETEAQSSRGPALLPRPYSLQSLSLGSVLVQMLCWAPGCPWTPPAFQVLAGVFVGLPLM